MTLHKQVVLSPRTHPLVGSPIEATYLPIGASSLPLSPPLDSFTVCGHCRGEVRVDRELVMDTQKESHENPLRHLWGFLSEVVWSVSRWFSGYRNPVDDPLNNPEKAYGKLEEDKYKAELELVDRYQSYVAELLRLSLLGIAVFGFLYKDMFTDLGPTPLLTLGGVAITLGGVAKTLAAAGVVLFGFAAAFSLIF